MEAGHLIIQAAPTKSTATPRRSRRAKCTQHHRTRGSLAPAPAACTCNPPAPPNAWCPAAGRLAAPGAPLHPARSQSGTPHAARSTPHLLAAHGQQRLLLCLATRLAATAATLRLLGGLLGGVLGLLGSLAPALLPALLGRTVTPTPTHPHTHTPTHPHTAPHSTPHSTRGHTTRGHCTWQHGNTATRHGVGMGTGKGGGQVRPGGRCMRHGWWCACGWWCAGWVVVCRVVACRCGWWCGTTGKQATTSPACCRAAAPGRGGRPWPPGAAVHTRDMGCGVGRTRTAQHSTAQAQHSRHAGRHHVRCCVRHGTSDSQSRDSRK